MQNEVLVRWYLQVGVGRGMVTIDVILGGLEFINESPSLHWIVL